MGEGGGSISAILLPAELELSAAQYIGMDDTDSFSSASPSSDEVSDVSAFQYIGMGDDGLPLSANSLFSQEFILFIKILDIDSID